MKPLTAVALLLCILFTVSVRSAPTSTPSLTFTGAVKQTSTLVEKILADLPGVHRATITVEGLTLDPPAQTTNLQMMVMSLDIPAAPVIKPVSERFTLDMSVSRMLTGTQLYQGLLEVLSSKLGGLTDLKADLRDLDVHIKKMKEVAQLEVATEQSTTSDLASRLHGDYDVQVAVHLTLSQLRSFCHDLMRGLRNVAASRPQAAR